jgi:ATP-binding cassette, subfamily B (MDR/TAP), member 7
MGRPMHSKVVQKSHFFKKMIRLRLSLRPIHQVRSCTINNYSNYRSVSAAFLSYSRFSSSKPALPKSTLKRDVEIIQSLIKYIWPVKDYKIKSKVVLAISLLITGKLLNTTVPYLFKEAIDLLHINQSDISLFGVLGTVLVGYGAARLGSNMFQELRNAVFGSVAQRAIRSAARTIFNRLLHLNSEFHNHRQTGGLVRAIDRGTKGINQVLSATVFHIFPTIFEISVVCGILTWNYGGNYAIVTVATIASYIGYTVLTTQWRIQFRKQMNLADNTASATATDSLLNVEAVQQYNNQDFETKKYDRSLINYEKAAIMSTTSLAILNAGQNAIFSVSLTAMVKFILSR